jgi:hypothetical protein
MLRNLAFLLYSRRHSTYFWCEIHSFFGLRLRSHYMCYKTSTSATLVNCCMLNIKTPRQPQTCEQLNFFLRICLTRGKKQSTVSTPEIQICPRNGYNNIRNQFHSFHIMPTYCGWSFCVTFSIFFKTHYYKHVVFSKGTDNLGSTVPLTLNFLSIKTLSFQSRCI